MDAMSGMGSLCRQRMSKRSSIKPSRMAVKRDRREER